MDDKYLVVSDIHGNVSAFESVLNDCKEEIFKGIFILGDCIDYGMRSNEIIEMIKNLASTLWKDKILVNIWGNHEKLLIDQEWDKLSTDRGRIMARYTARNISKTSMDYIVDNMNCSGYQELEIGHFKCLAVHGSLKNYFWNSVKPENPEGNYSAYDIVFSGHSHCAHCFSRFYSEDNEWLRNRKSVLFINPGSVGQPRNQNSLAQYSVISLPSKRVELRAVAYDIEYEQSLFPKEIDEFYKRRLLYGV